MIADSGLRKPSSPTFLCLRYLLWDQISAGVVQLISRFHTIGYRTLPTEQFCDRMGCSLSFRVGEPPLGLSPKVEPRVDLLFNRGNCSNDYEPDYNTGQMVEEKRSLWAIIQGSFGRFFHAEFRGFETSSA